MSGYRRKSITINARIPRIDINAATTAASERGIPGYCARSIRMLCRYSHVASRSEASPMLTSSSANSRGPTRRLVDDGRDDPRDEIPILGQLKRDHRLHVENVIVASLVPALKLKLFCSGTLMRSATGFCVFFASSVSSCLPCAHRGAVIKPATRHSHPSLAQQCAGAEDDVPLARSGYRRRHLPHAFGNDQCPAKLALHSL
jgi:hypothetical protein